ncbi:MAG: Spo0B domain-containing protein [Clostridia bacterium]|nr:Spo0B domain-containing protein [Clostridia bacterium]
MGNIDKINKKALILVNVILGQTLLVVFIVTYNRLWIADEMMRRAPDVLITAVFTVATVILTALGVWLIRTIMEMAAKEVQAEANEARLEESLEFIEVLRSHRHDYLNHLQVISGLLDLGMNDRAKQYIWELAKDIKEEKGLQLADHAEINALLVKKWALAEVNKVAVSLEVTADLRSMTIPSYDLTRILGNLIENAIQATTQVDESQRKVEVGIHEDPTKWIFIVFNQLPIIPLEMQQRVFERGFSTKGTEGRGLGLDIVCNLLEKYNGTIDLVSKDGLGTVFTAKIPKKQ